MDFFKKGQDFLNKNKNNNAAAGSSNPQQPVNPQQPGAPVQGQQPAQQQDYGDKGTFSHPMHSQEIAANPLTIAFAMAAKKGGYNVDPKTQESITDGARGLYEKFTG